MLHVLQCVRETGAPWSVGDHVAYSPFDVRKCVLHVETGRFFGTDMVPVIHRDLFSGALRLIYDVVEDTDITELLHHEPPARQPPPLPRRMDPPER